MRRNFTVYGLRFSKTSFWNRLNTGFPDPAVATVLTVYGIETGNNEFINVDFTLLQQYLPFTVLKPGTTNLEPFFSKLQQYLPFTVLKLESIMSISIYL